MLTVFFIGEICMKKYRTKKVTSALKDALLKKAIGFTCSETIEEYASSENQLTLTKRKVTTKEIPPDTTALKALLEMCGEVNTVSLESLTDEELEQEKQKIIDKLKGEIK